MVHRGFSTGRARRAHGIVLAAVLGLAVVAQIPALAATAAPTVHIQDGGSSFINATQASAVSVTGTYDAADPTILSIAVSIPNSGGTCAAGTSPTLTATLSPLDGTFVAGPFDVTNDTDYAQGVALCATAQAIAANPVDNSAIANSDNLPVKDTVAPAAPASVTLDNPINTASQGSVGVAVTGEAGTTAVVSVDDTDTLTAPVTATVAVPGTAQVNVSTLGDGTLTASVSLKDAAGNSGAALLGSATKDTLAPAAITVATPADGSSYAPGSSVTVAGAAPTANKVLFSDDNGVVQSITVDGSGNFSKILSGLSEGNHYLQMRAVDAAGNVGPRTDLNFIIDRLVPVITSPNADVLPSIFALAGTGKANSEALLYEGNVALGRVTVSANGTWVKDLSLSDGTHLLTARGVGTDGRTSGVSAPFSVLVDSSRPTVAITSPANNALIVECGTQPTGTLPLPTCPFSAVFSPVKFTGTATDAGPAGHMGVKRVDVKFVNAITGATAFTSSACTNCGLNVTAANWSLEPVIPLGGYFDVIVTSRDFAGNVSTTAAIEVLIL